LSGDNWFGGGAKTPPPSKTRTAPAPAPTSKASGGGGNWFGGGSSSASPTASKKKSVLGQLGGIVKAVPSGLVGLGKDIGVEAKAAVAPHNLPIVKAFVDAPKPHAGESQHDFKLRTAPLGTKTGESVGRTLGDLRHPTHFSQASQQGTIVGKVLEDAANAALVLGPLSKGASAVADRTAAAAAEESAGAAGRATVARVGAKAVHVAARGAETVAGAPLKPWELATTGVEAGPVLSRLPGVAAGDKVGLIPAVAKGLNRAAESEGVVGQVARTARLDPQSRMLRREALTPAMDEQSAAVGRQVKLGQQVASKLKSPAEEQAMFLVGEGQAHALAKLRATAPDRFDSFVADTFGDSVTPEAAHLAADVAEGKAPDAAARIDEALAAGRMGAGGRIQRTEQYLTAKPGRDWQAGYEPDQRAIDAAIEKPLAQLPKAEKLARTLRQRAESAGESLNQARADESARLDERAVTEGARRLEQKRTTLGGAVSRQEQRAVAAADRLTSLRDLQEAAGVPRRELPPPNRVDVGAQRLTRSLTAADRRRAAVTAGEEQLATSAERSVPTVAEQVQKDRGTLRSKYVKAAADRAEQVRNDLAQFFVDGPLGKVDLQATQADWVRNLPAHVRKALQRGLGLVEDAGAHHAQLGPDEFMHNAHRVNASLSGMSDEEIANYITQLYDEYRGLRSAPRVRAEDIRPSHLRSAGIADPYLEAIASPSSHQDVAAWLQEQGIAPPAAEVERRQMAALGGAGETMVGAEQVAADTLKAGGTRADAVAAAADKFGEDGGRLAGRHFDKLAAEGRVPVARGKLTGLFDRRGENVGRAAERANQGKRITQLEQRRLANLTGKLEALPDVADPARVNPTYGTGKRLGSLETRASQAQNLANRSDAVLGRLRERVRTTAEKTADSVDAAPARLRPALEVNRGVTGELKQHAQALRAQGLHDAATSVEKAAAEIPTTLKAFEAAGVDPEHFIHVRAGDRPTSAGAKGERLPRISKARSEKFRGDSVHFDRSVRAQTQGEIDEAKAVIARQTFDKIASMPFAAKLGHGPLEGVTTQEEAIAAGYEPWNPRMLMEKGKVSRAEQARVAAGEQGTTVFVPKHIFDGFRSYFNDPAVEQILRKTYDPAIQGIKVGQLALSPSWQVGNVIGNVSMATFGAGLNPVELGRAVIDAIKQYRASGPKGERSFEDVVPRRLLTAGPTHSEFRFLRPPDEQPLGRFPRVQKAAEKLGTPARLSYAANEFVDNIGRSAVFLAKKSKGLSDEEAVKAALQAMGDFSRMTPFERRFVRRAIPYYAWSRHITTLAFQLPIEHPLRVAWTLHLADEYADPDTRDLPGSLAGAVKLPGGKLLEAGRFFPFGDAGRILEPNGVESQLSPLAKIPVQSRQGVNLSSGKPFSRPPGTGRHDEFGAQLPTAPSIAHQVGGLFPQKRLVDSLTGRDKVARYDTGDKVLTAKGPIATGKNAGTGFLRFLGVPVQNAGSAEDMAKRIADKQLANDKLKAGYQKKKKKSGR
jgi:hypothetical protein